MNTILDYLEWRGDIPFSASPFNEVDALILSQLSYCDFSGVISDNISDLRNFDDVTAAFFDREKTLGITSPGGVINPLTFKLLEKCAESERFKTLRLFAYVEELDKKTELQFSCFSALIPDGTIIITFRGTDSTLTGWKEDFNMSIMDEVPSQKQAVNYLNWIGKKNHKPIILCGHSKGGNLSVFSGAFAKPQITKRIKQIYNNDGPGFLSSVLSQKEMEKVTPKIFTFIPQASIVGRLLEHSEESMIIESSGTDGIMQHDPFSWNIKGKNFVKLEKLTKESDIVNDTIKAWLNKVDIAKRKLFVDTLFQIFEKTKIDTLTELGSNWLKTATFMLKSLNQVDPETKEVLKSEIFALFDCAKQSIPLLNRVFGSNSKTNKSKIDQTQDLDKNSQKTK